MIEINLLPPEYRMREKTNLPLLAVLVVGFGLLSGLTGWYLTLTGEVNSLQSQYDEAELRREELKVEAKKVDDLEREIKRQASRQDTIIEISQSKIMWSLKLKQLSEIMGGFDGFWLDTLSLAKGGRSAGKLTMSVSGMTSTYDDVARFRDALKYDPNFAYHFEDLKSESTRREELQGYANATEKLVFRVELPLATVVAAKGR